MKKFLVFICVIAFTTPAQAQWWDWVQPYWFWSDRAQYEEYWREKEFNQRVKEWEWQKQRVEQRPEPGWHQGFAPESKYYNSPGGSRIYVWESLPGKEYQQREQLQLFSHARPGDHLRPYAATYKPALVAHDEEDEENPALQELRRSTCRILVSPKATKATLWNYMHPNIPVETSQRAFRWSGSGVVYDVDDRYIWIYTAGHVVRGNLEAYVQMFHNGRSQIMKGYVHKARWSPNVLKADLAIVKLERRWLKGYPVPLKARLSEQSLDDVLAVTCSRGKFCNHVGTVTKQEKGLIFCSFDEAIQPGMSGSPVADKNGKVGGILVRGEKQLGVAVPWRYLKK